MVCSCGGPLKEKEYRIMNLKVNSRLNIYLEWENKWPSYSMLYYLSWLIMVLMIFILEDASLCQWVKKAKKATIILEDHGNYGEL